ncbi:hypothetical protein AGABI1DRAFT_65945 [Agaricus bisporus var. burnettii JB137-S8]|uniref:Uncharacterized protein n=1 Tax=Agaricus bisporus var. burnettii (strain JB137-S8 / ATCC MYA-4627 / FGSC 10392) TaxID=597362 RepID=K5Y5K7_AGABU|nr:uncharacterized protein AGABI1DRAFT_65945 [Agaricus bisporus var. burnettii JB137-S8]EKM83395.1 hypothetical protein AGABI1DRAFT_65945 [Agaricus bisporus var. burnettii JB137-S8]
MARPRDQLPRLNIAPSLNAQQPVGMYSPALPTALQQSFHPPFPIQPYYGVNTSPQPSHRPTHHPGSASLAHFPGPGMHPPNGFAMNPAAGHMPRHSLMLAPGQLPHFPHRRRQPSIGGPPKAVLGGPARKLSPIPPGISITPAVPPKSKKAPINLPKETVLADGDSTPTRPSWARTPLPTRPGEGEPDVEPVQIVTREVYPPEAWLHMMPEVVDVFLPGRQQAMEEKLKKLGVERGSGSNVPQILAPHARAASISSPADPNLLLFKLNQLQRSREGSAHNSLTASPQPLFALSSPSIMSTPGFSLPRHAHTMSLAHLPSHNHRSPFEEGASTNPFGHDAVLGNDHPQPTSPYLLETVPSVAMNPNFSTLAPPPPLSAIQPPENRPDFIRGFGLDIPEEEEPEEEEERRDSENDESVNPGIEIEIDEDVDKTHRSFSQHTSPFQSRRHSRHTSKLSAHLSLGSFGGSDLAPSILHKKSVNGSEDMHIENEESHIVTDDVDAVREWTGTDSSDDESIGEWSNPSDEERARRQRIERRLRRRAAKLNLDKPRRIPNFPRPPHISSGLGSIGGRADLVSNPSDENLILGPQASYMGVDPTFSSPARSSQALPHSRSGSAPYSAHDPAQAHSRTPSDYFVYPGTQHHHQQSSLSKRDLNPFAKPFVFGTALVGSPPVVALSDSSASHARLSSFGNRPLNVAAPEFKPGGFTFRPPPGVPQMPLPGLGSPVFPTSLPPPPPRDKDENSPRPHQGREKRQRRGSLDSEEGGDNSMLSFKFPRDADSPRANGMMRSASYSGSRDDHSHSRSNDLDAPTEPFTFAGFSAVARLPVVPSVPPEEDVGFGNGHRFTPQEESTLRNEVTVKGGKEGDEETYALPSSGKKRAPIPLDFKNTTSSRNTVPAGLFKALANEDRTRKTVRSRLDSRDLFDHFRRPSMDDNDVPQISHKSSHVRLGGSKDIRGSMSDVDVVGTNHHSHRRSSLPDNLDDLDSSSEESVAPMNLTGRMEMHRIEHVVGEILDAKFSELQREISRSASRNTQTLNPSTEAQIADVISLFRAQLQESATRSLEDTQMDARGEMDFQLIKDVVERGQKELMNLVRSELKDMVGVGASGGSVHMENGTHGLDVQSMVEAVGNRVISAVRESILDLVDRQEAINHTVPAWERDALADKLVMVLTPILASLRTEPLDYEFLTSQLTQAVKPHITQLIDLASDKRETASIIVDSILPLLPPNQPVLDMDALTLQLITEVRRAIAPIDAFEIREQVADLVVERLDSRLAVRNKGFNVEIIGNKVNEVVAELVEPLRRVPGEFVERLEKVRDGFREGQEVVGGDVKRVLEVVGELPGRFEGRLEGVLVKLEEALAATVGKDRDYPEIKTLVEALTQDVIEHNTEALAVNKDILEKVQNLPETVNAATMGLQKALADLIHSRDLANQDIDELRKSNSEYQLQLAKARGAHGQVRVEKDMLNERLDKMEVERERMRVKVEDLERSEKSRNEEKRVLEGRNVELEEALSKALVRLQTADVTSQANMERIGELERGNDGLESVKNAFEAKVLTLETQLQLASHERESATRALDSLQKQHDELQAQQSHWEDLRQASEKIDILTNLIGQADNEELLELRRYREQSRMLEADYNNLQKRFKELENKFGTSERSVGTTKQNLAQAQQKVVEWERRAKESEGLVEALQTKLDQAEQTHAQLDADHSLVKLQLEEREAEYRAIKDRETRSRDTITALENKIRTMQVELEKRATATKTVPEPARTPSYRTTTTTNGHSNGPIRPDSRSSMTFGDRSATPTRRMSSYVSTNVAGTTPPQPSVWDSMHAPRGPVKHPSLSTVHAPAGRYPSNIGRGTPKTAPPYRSNLTPVRQPSPALSVVSNAPTLGEDGWWE